MSAASEPRTQTFFAYTSAFCLGCLWLWRLSGINQTPRTFGIETSFDESYKMTLEIAAALVFVVFALLSRQLSSRRAASLIAVGGCLGSYGGLGLLLLAHFQADFLLGLVSAGVEGVSIAALFRAWMNTRPRCKARTLGIILSSSAAGALLLLLSRQYLPDCILTAAMVLSPLAAALALMVLCRRCSDFSEEVGNASHGAERNPDGAQTPRSRFSETSIVISLISLVLASSFIDFHYVIPPSSSGVYCAAVTALVLVACFANYQLSTGKLFLIIAVFMLALISVGLFFPERTELFKGLSFTAFCLINIYAFGWALDRDETRNAHLRLASGFIAAMIATSLVARLCIGLLDVPTVFSLCAILLALAFGSLIVPLASRQRAGESLARDASAGKLGEKDATLAVWPREKEDADDTSAGPLEDEEDTVDPLAAQCRRLASEKKLTAREAELLLLLARGYTLRAVAERLTVSDNTIKYHRRNIYQKLGVSSKQELIDLVYGNRPA